MEVYENPANLFVAGFIGSPAMNFFKTRLVDANGTLAVRGENFELRVPDHLQKRFSAAKGRDVIFGIRPEHVYDQELKGAFSGGEKLKCFIEVVEPIGSEVILLAKCGSEPVTARVDPATRLKSQTTAELIWDLNSMHLFDAET